MSISPGLLTESGDETDLSSYATASVSPSAGRLVVASCANTQNSDNAVQPTISGNGQTWTTLGSVLFATGNRRRITLFAAFIASPSAGAITFDFGGTTQQRLIWSVTEFSGVGGTNVATAVLQTVTNTGTTPLTVTLAAFNNANNGAFGCFSANDTVTSPTSTPGTGWTELSDRNNAGVSPINLSTQWRVDNDTTCDASFTGTISASAGIAIEIVAAAVATNTPPHILRGLGLNAGCQRL
jgi:hypothetical protein